MVSVLLSIYLRKFADERLLELELGKQNYKLYYADSNGFKTLDAALGRAQVYQFGYVQMDGKVSAEKFILAHSTCALVCKKGSTLAAQICRRLCPLHDHVIYSWSKLEMMVNLLF